MTNIRTIKIQTDVPEIPIEIGKLKYSFSLSDENIAKFREKSLEVRTKLEKMSEDTVDDDNAIEVAKDALRTGYDAILGDGAFDDIYKQTKSVTYLMQYFVQLSQGVSAVLSEMGIADPALNRYQRREKAKEDKKKK